jgi:hypothetical protein
MIELREIYRDHEALVSDAGARLLSAVRRRRRRVVRNRFGYAAAALAIVATIGGVATVTHRPSSAVPGSPATAPGTISLPSVVDLPVGYQWISSLGAQFAAPADWVFNDFDRCGTADGKPTVVRDPGPTVGFKGVPDVQRCAGDDHLLGRRQFAWIGSFGAPIPAEWGVGGPAGPVQRLAIPGLSDATIYPVANHQYLGTASDYDPDVTLVVRADSEAAVETILGSLRSVSTDFAGCPSVSLPGRPARSPLVTFVDPDPASISLCYYGGDQGDDDLLASNMVTGAAATGLATALNATPISADPAPGRCSWTSPTGMDGIVVVRGKDHTAQQLYLEFSGCGPAWIDNGQTYRQFTHSITAHLFSGLGLDWTIRP